MTREARSSGEVARLLVAAGRRRQERGAALFLVVMVLSIVSAIGVFSMRSASLVDVAAGYARQSVQSTLVAEYAARAAATYLETNPSLVDGTERVSGCAPALGAIDPDSPCTVLLSALLADSIAASAPSPPAGDIYGQLSQTNDYTRIQAEFVTEMTEPTMASVTASPGFTSGMFRQVTFTTVARIFPVDLADTTASGVCAPAASAAVTQQTVRAHVIVPM